MSGKLKTYEAFLRQYLKQYGSWLIDVTESEDGGSMRVHIDGKPYMTFPKPDTTRASLGVWLETTTDQLMTKLRGVPRMKTAADLSSAELLDLFETSVRGRHEMTGDGIEARDGTIAALRREVLARMGDPL